MFNIPEKTQQEKVTEAIRFINLKATDTIENAKAGYHSLFYMFWYNQEVSPQEICDQLGTEAFKVFENSARWIETIKQFDPSWEFQPAPYNFTINADGTVSIGDIIEVSNHEE